MIKLDYQFSAETILKELEGRQFIDHQEYPNMGLGALLLVTTNGEQNHAYDVPMMPTKDLTEMPYTKSIWGTLGIPMVRSRLMSIGPKRMTPIHKDTNPWWLEHDRIHIPVKTNPSAVFMMGNRVEHFQTGTTWLLSTSKAYHAALNGGDDERIHLVIDVPKKLSGDLKR